LGAAPALELTFASSRAAAVGDSDSAARGATMLLAGAAAAAAVLLLHPARYNLSRWGRALLAAACLGGLVALAGGIATAPADNVLAQRFRSIFVEPADPADLPRQLARALEKGVDMVNGIRAKRQDSWFRKISSKIGNGTRGPVTTRLQAMYFDCVKGRSPAHAGWLSHV
jgi:hypothetical protein